MKGANMAEEKTYESKELLKSNINWSNPNDVLDLIKLVINTQDDTKMKLFVLGEILTQNKNEMISSLKAEGINLNKKIHNQRNYINKLKKSLQIYKTKLQQNSNTLNNISERIDREAYNKAKNNWDNSYNHTKKKIVVRKKPYNNYK